MAGGGGEPSDFSNVLPCTQVIFFEKVSKLVKIVLGVSLVFLEKQKRQKAKGKPS